MLAVVVVLGILGAAAVPMLLSNTDQEADAEVEHVKSMIRHVQAMATSRDLEFKIVFQVGGTKVSVDRIYPGPMPVIPDEDAYTVTLEYGSIESADFGGVSRIEFDTGGKVKAAGSVTLNFKGLKKKISVEERTGYITITEL
jgi:type II secretory pathway pseudopilin PulG